MYNKKREMKQCLCGLLARRVVNELQSQPTVDVRDKLSKLLHQANNLQNKLVIYIYKFRSLTHPSIDIDAKDKRSSIE
jgi:hypothetical protein